MGEQELEVAMLPTARGQCRLAEFDCPSVEIPFLVGDD